MPPCHPDRRAPIRLMFVMLGLFAAVAIPTFVLGSARTAMDSIAAPGEHDEDARVQTALDRIVPEIALADASLDTFLDWFRRQLGLNVHVRAAEIDANFDANAPRRTIRITLQNVSLEVALSLALHDAAGRTPLGYEICDGTLVIGVQEEFGRSLETRVYPIADLLSPELAALEAHAARPTLAQLADPEFRERLAGSTAAPPDAPGLSPTASIGVAIRQLTELIQDSVIPDAWMKNGGSATIHVWRTVLVVRAPLAAHRELDRLLTALRATQ